MLQRELEMKLPTSPLSFQGQSSNSNVNPSRKECSSTTPTIPRESCSKNQWEGASGSHIFRSSTPHLSSHSTSTTTMDHSRTSSPSFVEMMNESCDSTIGLPSDYPLHRKNTSFSSFDLEEELEDFEIFLDENTSFERAALHTSLTRYGVESNSCGTLLVTSGTSTSRTNGPTKRHRPIHSDLFSFDTLLDTTRLDQAHHRRHNYALGQDEFNESVLTELFEVVAIAIRT